MRAIIVMRGGRRGKNDSVGGGGRMVIEIVEAGGEGKNDRGVATDIEVSYKAGCRPKAKEQSS